MKERLRESEIVSIAEAMLDVPVKAVELGLIFFDEEEQGLIVDEIIKALHRRRSETARTIGRRKSEGILAPRVMMSCKGKGQRNITVKYRGKDHVFEQMERALSFCDLVREIESSMFVPEGIRRSPVVTYGSRGVFLGELVPEVFKRTVYITVQT